MATMELTESQVEALKGGKDIEFTEEQLSLLGKEPKVAHEEPETLRRFAELEDNNKKLETELRKATESLGAMQRDSQRKQFAEFVRSHRLAFQGEVDANVDKLERLSKQLMPADMDEMLREKETLNERLRASEMFSQVGSTMPMQGTTPIEAAVKAEISKGMKEADAVAKVASEHPNWYIEYDREQKRHARTGGE